MAELESFDVQTKTKMYWVVDAYTKLVDDFDFSYYPTQYDVNKIQVYRRGWCILQCLIIISKGTFPLYP